MKGLTVLGSTGSVGLSTLDVVQRNPGEFRVHALSARSNHTRMAEQCLRFRPRYAVMLEERAAEMLHQTLAASSCETQVLCGAKSLEKISSLAEVDAVMAAIVGGAGLLPTLAAAQAGKQVLLANKESLVMSGQVLMDAVKDNGAQLLPIDSEHNAIFQCMPKDFSQGLAQVGVERILLTASGGPFLSRTPAELHDVTPEQACSHPTWDMGRKISVDSASMMNKGLEVIEACWLFGTDSKHIEVVIHPQSVIHSMVQYSDGSTLAQLGNPDMRTPIAHALFWPSRGNSGVDMLDMVSIANLSFAKPDLEQFPCLRLCYEAAEIGASATTTLNGANEVAVEAFLNGRIRFTDIVDVIEKTLDNVGVGPADYIGMVLEADTIARQEASEMVAKLTAAA